MSEERFAQLMLYEISMTAIRGTRPARWHEYVLSDNIDNARQKAESAAKEDVNLTSVSAGTITLLAKRVLTSSKTLLSPAS